MEILKELAECKVGPYVFPGWKREGPISNMAMSKVLKLMNRTDITVHGFRSTFRDWAGEQTNYAREIIEHALAHKLKDKAEAAYARSTMPERRRKLMEEWASYCNTRKVEPTKILPIRAAK